MRWTFALAGLAVAGVVWWRRSPSSSSLLEGVAMSLKRAAGIPWTPPPAAEPYRLTIQAAEGRHGIPENLLARLLYQESRFRPDVINGTTPSPAGALGIAQIVPKYHPGVDPLDPEQAIEYAANYLASLKAEFGSWEKALGAYNWGPGNLTKAIGQAGEQWLAIAPTETRLYVIEITADVPLRANA